MELAGSIFLVVFAAANVLAVIFVTRMEAPLHRLYRANNDMTSRNSKILREEKPAIKVEAEKPAPVSAKPRAPAFSARAA